MFDILVPVRSSSCVDYVTVNPVNGTANVNFTNGVSYRYTNVSRRAIANLLVNPNMSLGFWVNNNCITSERVNISQRYAINFAAV